MESIRSFKKTADALGCSTPSLRRCLGALLAAAAAALVPAGSAIARGYEYGSPQRTINAGIISDYGDLTSAAVSSSPGYPVNPYVFAQLNDSTDALPVGWILVNPLAPRNVNETISQTWGYNLGDPVTNNMGAYWAVPLQSTAEAQLQQFQVLLLEVNQDPNLAAPDLEKLRQYVDGGGILWIDGIGSSAALGNTFTSWLQASVTGSNSPDLETLSNGGGTFYGPALSLGIPAINDPYDLSLGLQFDYMTGGATQYSSLGAVSNNPDPLFFLGERQTDASNHAYVGVGHLGAGEVIFTPWGLSSVIGAPSAASQAVPTTLTTADIPLLQLASNLIAQSNTSLNALRDRQAASANDDAFGTAVMPTWRYTVTGASASAQAVTYGRFAYVVNPADSSVHWLDLTPTGNQASNEFGKVQGYTPAVLGTAGSIFSTPAVWPGFCAFDSSFTGNPTSLADGGADGFVHLFVEDSAGAVHWVNMASGDTKVLPVSNPSGNEGGSAGSLGTFGSGVPPAPIVYEHRIFATEPNGQLFISDLLGTPYTGNPYTGTPATGFSDSGGTTYTADPLTGTEVGMGSPVVGIVHDDCNNIVAAYTTNRGLYTILCGARGEKLVDAGFDPSGDRLYATKLAGSAPMNSSNTNGTIDPYPASYGLYTLSPGGVKQYITLSATTPIDQTGQHFVVPSTGTGGTITDPGAGEVFADYDVNWNLSQFSETTNSPLTSQGALDRLMVGYANSTLTTSGSGGAYATMMSSPTMDQNGDIFYIDNFSSSNGAPDTSVTCLRDAYQVGNSKLRWRYRLPTANDFNWFVAQASTSNTQTGLKDAAGRDYSLIGNGFGPNVADQYWFVGTPVIDSRGSVYAAATDGVNSAIFRFDTGDTISASLAVGNNAITTSSVQIIQQSAGASVDEFGSSPQFLNATTNFSANSAGQITFGNFGQLAGNTMYPLFSEGEPVNVQYTYSGGQGTGLPPPNVPLFTNVSWVADLSSTGNQKQWVPSSITNVGVITGMAVVGDYLYFGAIGQTGTTHLYRLYTQDSGTGGADPGYYDMTVLNTNKKRVLEDLGDTGVGAATPLASGISSTGNVTASNGTVEVSGPNGIVNFQTEMTLVTDHNRLLGLDADGDAMFAVDSTDNNISYQPQGVNPPTQTATTSIPLNRPTDVTQLSTDRYLLADRGNNRCVEIDRNGDILWELSKFADSYGLLAAGDPLTLNDPSSVQIWRDSCQNVHYLIADSGNYRIVDVVDTFTNGDTSPVHVLDWVSETGDRNYRFESAFRYIVKVNGYGTAQAQPVYEIAALVTNKKIAPLIFTANGPVLQPTSFDSPGSSIVMLDAEFPASIVNGEGTATTPAICGSFIASATTGEIINVLSTLQTTTQTGNNGAIADFAPKNSRYLASYTPDPNAAAQIANYDGHDELLYCDDNGAFDLDPVWSPATPGTDPYANANWWLNQTTYQGLTTTGTTNTTPISADTTQFARTNIPFVPTCIQRVGTDAQAGTNGNTYTGRYLIVNTYAQGTFNQAFGATTTSGTGGTTTTSTVPPGFSGEAFLVNGLASPSILTDRTFCRPSNTSPLSQPTCAVFAK